MPDIIQFQNQMQKAFGKYYANSNYPTTVANDLMQVMQDKYANNMTSFQETFVKPTQKLLEKLQQNRMPLYVKQDQMVKIIVHLVLFKKLQTGEFFFCVGHTRPGTLTVKFRKYVTEFNGGTVLNAEPEYITVKMTVDEDSYNECLTLDYFEGLRTYGKQRGTERTSVMFRLCWVKVLTQKFFGGLLKIYNAEDVLSHTKQKNKLEKSVSSPVQPIQRLQTPQQVSEDASSRRHHPMEELLHSASKITRQPACEDESRPVTSDQVESNKPHMEWQEDATGMGEGEYVPSTSDNINSQTNTRIHSDKTVASKFPVNEMQSQNTDSRSGDTLGWGSLSSTASGNIHSTALGSSGPDALQFTGDLEPAAQKKNKYDNMEPAREVRNEYVTQGKESVGPTIASSCPPRRTATKLAKDVSDGYVGELEGSGPTGTVGVHFMAKGNNPQPATYVDGDKHASSVLSGVSSSKKGAKNKPAKDVDNGYVGRFKGIGPYTTSSSMAQTTEESGVHAKEVSDGYVSEFKGTGPGNCL